MADRNLGLQLLITAKDAASSVLGGIGKAIKFLDSEVSAIAGKIRESVGGMFGGGVDSSIEFEAALARVQAKAEASDADLAKLKKAAEGAARELGLGADGATQAAQALEYLTGAGLSVDQAIGALPATLKIAKNEQISTEESARNLTDTLSIMGLGFDETGRAADVLQKSAAMTSTSVSALSEALRNGGGTAVKYGYDFEQTITILTAFAKAGIQGSNAGTALSAILNDIADPASKARQEMAKFGVSTSSVQEFIGKLIELGPRGLQVIRGFSDEAGPGLAALLKQGTTGLQEYSKALNEDAVGSLDRASKTINTTTKGALEKLSSTWAQVKQALSEPLLKPMAEGAEALSTKLGELQKSGILQSIGDGIAKLFTDAGNVALDFIKRINWNDLKTEATGAIDGVRNALNETINGVQGRIQTVSDWTTAIFSPLNQAIDGYRLAWALANKDQAEAARLQAQIEARTGAIGRALSGTSAEYQKTAGSAKELAQQTQQATKATADLGANAEKVKQLTTAIADQQAVVDRLYESNQKGKTSDEELAAALQKLWDMQSQLKKTQAELGVSQQALVSSQNALNQSVAVGVPETQKAAQAAGELAKNTDSAATATKALAEQADSAKDAGAQYAISWAQAGAEIPRLTEQHIELGNGIAEITRATGAASGPMTEWNGALVKAHEGTTKFGDEVGKIPAHLTSFADKTAEVDRQIKAASDNTGNWREGLKLNAVQMYGLKETAAALAQKVVLVEDAQRKGLATDKDVAAVKQAANAAQDRYNKALDEYVTQQERAIAAAQRAGDLTQQQFDLDVQRKQNALELAEIKGDENEITRAQNDLIDTQISKAQAAVASKAQEIEAYKANIEAVRQKLAADGELSAADQAQLATMQDTLTGLQLEQAALVEDANAQQDRAEAIRESSKRAAEGMDLFTDSVRRNQQMTERQKEAAKEATANAQVAGSIISSFYNSAIDSLSVLSDKAVSAFKTMRGETVPTGTELERLQKQVDQTANAVANVPLSAGGFALFLNKITADANRVRQAFIDQAQSAEQLAINLSKAGQGGAGAMQALIREAEGSKERFDLLDDARLDKLQSAIDETKRKIEDMAQSTEDARQRLAEMNAELLEAKGEDEKAKRLQQEIEYAERLAELNRQMQEAEASGNREQLALLQQQKQVLDEINQQKLQNIQSEADAQRKQKQADAASNTASAPSSSGGGSSAPAKTYQLNLVGQGGKIIPAKTNIDPSAFLDELEASMRSTI